MKLNTTTLVLGIALTVVAGLFSSTIFGLAGTKNDAHTSPSAAGLITGHVITTVRDAEGNIKEYRQTDNQVLNQGENCVAKMLFSGHGGFTGAGTTVCVGDNSDGFRYIQIGNSTQAVTSADVKLGNPHNSTSFGSGASLNIKAGTTNWFANSTGTGSTTTDTRISATFQNGAPTSQTVSESGLFNATSESTNGIFARQTFSSITLNNGDSLTVEWRINIGGTTTFN